MAWRRTRRGTNQVAQIARRHVITLMVQCAHRQVRRTRTRCFNCAILKDINTRGGLVRQLKGKRHNRSKTEESPSRVLDNLPCIPADVTTTHPPEHFHVSLSGCRISALCRLPAPPSIIIPSNSNTYVLCTVTDITPGSTAFSTGAP